MPKQNSKRSCHNSRWPRVQERQDNQELQGQPRSNALRLWFYHQHCWDGQKRSI